MTDLDLRSLERATQVSPDEPTLDRLAQACRRSGSPFPAWAWAALAGFGAARARRALEAANRGAVPLKIATVRRWARGDADPGSVGFASPPQPRRGGRLIFASLRAVKRSLVEPRAQVYAYSPPLGNPLHDYVVLGFGRAVLPELRRVWPEEFGPKKRPTWAQLEAWFRAAPWSPDRAILRREDLATLWAPRRPGVPADELSRAFHDVGCPATAFTLRCSLAPEHSGAHSWRSP